MILWLLAACQAPIEPVQTTGGVALGLFASDPAYDYRPLVDEIAELGASDLLIAVPWSLPERTDHALVAGTPRSALTDVLEHASQRGLRTTVMPLVVLQDRANGAWRGQIDPGDPDRFWSNYRGLLRRVAIDAERGGAHRLVVGSELNALEESDEWPTVVSLAREHFDGVVTYSANWDRYDSVSFWHLVDEVAVTAYVPVSAEHGFASHLDAMHTFADNAGKPLVVSEYGYPALATASERPWDETTGASYAPDLQKHLIDDALAALHCRPPEAHFLWDWFGTGAENEASFTPRNRPAADAVSARLQQPTCPEGSR